MSHWWIDRRSVRCGPVPSGTSAISSCGRWTAALDAMRTLFLLAAILGAIPSASLACSCRGTQSIGRALTDADAVIVGKVKGHMEPDYSLEHRRPAFISVQVVGSLKGGIKGDAGCDSCRVRTATVGSPGWRGPRLSRRARSAHAWWEAHLQGRSYERYRCDLSLQVRRAMGLR